MDNVTHTLMGVALSRAVFQRITPHATLLLLLAVNIPDLDLLSLCAGPLAAFEMHRGYTHTFLALPVLGLICVALTALFGMDNLKPLRAWGTACAGVGCHLMLDWTDSYGIRPLLPFSSGWHYLDLNGFYDAVMIAALGLALMWPLFAGLVGNEIGRKDKQTGQGSAIAVLLFLMAFEGGRWTSHRRALDDLRSRMYDGEAPMNVAALAEPSNPLKWTGIVETESAFRVVKTGSLDLSEASDARIFLKPRQDLLYRELMAKEAFRFMAYFSRFPVWGTEAVPVGSRLGNKVMMTDLRFGTPGDGLFQASAMVDRAEVVLESRFSLYAGMSREKP